MRVYTSSLLGVEAISIEVECDLSEGLPFFQIVGLPDTVIKESKVRVKSAIIQSGFNFPYDKRVVLNLAPSHVPKNGSALELALAVKLLESMGLLEKWEGYKHVLCLGELGLTGSVKCVGEMGALVLLAKKIKPDLVILSSECRNQFDSALAGLKVLYVDKLADFFEEELLIEVIDTDQRPLSGRRDLISLSEEISPEWARILQIVALGEHSVLLVGSPGSGKSFFAQKLPYFLGELEGTKAIEKESLDAIFGRKDGERPFISPHHSATRAGLIGSGTNPKPGAVTRAHGGVLFLDEIFEFDQQSLESLREVIEQKKVSMARGSHFIHFPADFLLIGASNPCRCGLSGVQWKVCRCLPASLAKYQSKMSGPLLDRFHIQVFSVDQTGSKAEKVPLALIRQNLDRIREQKIRPLWNKELDRHFLELSIRHGLTIRGQINAREVAFTIAKLDESLDVTKQHIDEAIFWNLPWTWKKAKGKNPAKMAFTGF